MTEFFSAVSFVTIYAPVAIGILYFLGFKKFNKVYKILTVYLVVIAIIQLTSFYIGRGGLGRSNLYMSHYYYVAQFILLTWFYACLLNKRWPYYLLAIVLLFIGFQFVNDSSLYYRYNPIAMALTQMIIVTYATIYLYGCLGKRGSFLITTCALLVYLLVSSIIFASWNLVIDLDISNTTRASLNNLNKVLYFALQIVLIIEWFKYYNVIKHRNVNPS